MNKQKLTVATNERLEGDSEKWLVAKLEELGVDYEIVSTAFGKTKSGEVIVALGHDTSRSYIGDYEKLYLHDTKYGMVIPTSHPANMYKEQGGKILIEKALYKAYRYLNGARYKDEKLLTNNHLKTVLAYLDECAQAKVICVDLETEMIKDGIPKEITAIGISKHEDEALCFSADMFGWDKAVERFKEVLSDPDMTVVGQNFTNFDAQVLFWSLGIEVKARIWDTMSVFKLLYPDMNRSGLGLQGSFFLMCPPWKDESWNTRGLQLRQYCAKDVIRTFRIQKEQVKDLQIQGNYKYYLNTVLPVECAVSRATIKGINFDHVEREQQKVETTKVAADLQSSLIAMAKDYLTPKQEVKKSREPKWDTLYNIEGLVLPEDTQKLKRADLDVLLAQYVDKKTIKELYVAKKQDTTKYELETGKLYKKAYKDNVSYKNRDYNPNSSQQTIQVLQAMGIQVPQKRKSDGSWGPGTGSLELRKILFKYASRPNIVDFAQSLMDYKPLSKFITGYLNAEFMEDGRWRSAFKVRGTETGRGSSQKYFGTYCGNIQNIPSRGAASSFKKCFTVDPGYTWFNFDQSAAESRVVAYMCKSKNLIDIFESGKDFHCATARSMFGLDATDAEIKKMKEREQAKVLNHSNSYGVGAFIMSGMFLKAKFNYGKEKVEALQELWHKAYPEIRGVFHKEIEEALHRDQMLVNPLGRVRHFTGEIGPRMYKQAYADIPQSTIPDISNLMWAWIAKTFDPSEAQVLLQCHDSLAGQVRTDMIHSFKDTFEAKSKELILTIKEQEFYIPWDYKFGRNYKEAN